MKPLLSLLVAALVLVFASKVEADPYGVFLTPVGQIQLNFYEKEPPIPTEEQIKELIEQIRSEAASDDGSGTPSWWKEYEYSTIPSEIDFGSVEGEDGGSYKDPPPRDQVPARSRPKDIKAETKPIDAPYHYNEDYWKERMSHDSSPRLHISEVFRRVYGKSPSPIEGHLSPEEVVQETMQLLIKRLTALQAELNALKEQRLADQEERVVLEAQAERTLADSKSKREQDEWIRNGTLLVTLLLGCVTGFIVGRRGQKMPIIPVRI